MKYFLNVLLCLFVVTPTFACTILPSNEEPDWGEIAKADSVAYLVKHSEIYLAKAVSKNTIYNHMAEFTFHVEKVIRGTQRAEINLEGADVDFKEGFYEHSYHEIVKDHTEPEFWSFQMDSGADFGDCTNKGFYRIGTSYLILLNDKSLRRSFEPIKTEEDLWLKTIELAAWFQNSIESYEREN